MIVIAQVPSAAARGDVQGRSLECEPDGVDGADGSSSAGFVDGSGVGVDFGAPFGAEAVGDLPIDSAGPDVALGAVVGGVKVATRDEDEQMPPDRLEDLLQVFAGVVCGRGPAFGRPDKEGRPPLEFSTHGRCRRGSCQVNRRGPGMPPFRNFRPWASNSSTSRGLRLNLKNSQTAWRLTSGGNGHARTRAMASCSVQSRPSDPRWRQVCV
jgi:hypothetical protein